MTVSRLPLAFVLSLPGIAAAAPAVRDLSLAERFEAQRTIDRIYFSHVHPGAPPQRIGWRIFFYLVRAQNGCGNGPASLGSSGSEMPAVNCP